MGKHKAVAAYRYALRFIKSRVRETIHTIRNVSLDGSHEVDLAQLTQQSADYRLHHHCSHLIGRECRLFARLGRSRQHRNHAARRGRDAEALSKHWSGFEKEEATIRQLGAKLVSTIQDAEAKTLVSDFLKAHDEMGLAYRRGLDTYKSSGFDFLAGGPCP